MDFEFKILNWNIGGAKYLELKKQNDKLRKPEEQPREEFRQNLNRSLLSLVNRYEPFVVTLQEVTEYSEEGDHESPEKVIDDIKGYKYFPTILIDTRRHSHQGKWNKVREKGGWTDNAYLAQGNAILVHENVSIFPVWSLPDVQVTYNDWLKSQKGTPTYDIASHSFVEEVLLESGLYFGDRNTEPRAASVMHMVVDGHLMDANIRLNKPLDIFVVNMHLTTLMLEREGVPEIDKKASDLRLNQLEIIFNGIISRYNKWKKEGFPIRGNKVTPRDFETHDRHSPIWILSGDFNFTPESEEYIYVKARNFMDLIESHKLGTKTSGLGQDPTLTVDYLFGGPLFEAIDPSYTFPRVSGQVIVNEQTKVSDHFPIAATLPINLPS